MSWSTMLRAVAAVVLLTNVAAVGSTSKEGVSEIYSHSDTTTTLYANGNFLKCTSDLHVTPTSTQEVSDLIKFHTSDTSKPVKIRVTRRGLHSSAGFPCPGSRSSTKEVHDDEFVKDESDTTSITVLLHLMNRVLSVDAEHKRITVEAGMTLLDLVNSAEANGLSVRAGALSIYGNLTVGGVIAAGAHGSGLSTTSSLGDLVTKVKWVNAKGDIIVSDSSTIAGRKELQGLVGGLGLLGVVTEFTLQLESPSRTIVESRTGLRDNNIVADVKKMLELETPHVVVLWRPDFGTYKAMLWTQVGSEEDLPVSAPAFSANARTTYMDVVDDSVASSVSELMAAWESDDTDESNDANVLNAGVCSVGLEMHGAPFFKDSRNGTTIERAIIPTNFAMLTTECSPKCIYQAHHMGTVTIDMEFTIKMSQIDDWVRDVKSVVRAELEEIQSQLDKRYGKGKVKRCLPPGYFWLRFGQGSNSLLSTSAGTEDVVYVQWTSLASALAPHKPAKQGPILETVEQLSLCKYNARPHWGKNHERVFRHPQCHVRDNLPAANVDQVLEMQRLHDPTKIFEPELFRHVLDRSNPAYSDMCTQNFWCYCQEDAHCPQGHACSPSPVFPEYNICKAIVSLGGKHSVI